MRRAVDPEWAAAFLRALGDELRRARKRQGWTRHELRARLGLGISNQTLATYELGTRSITVLRFVELARVLDKPAFDLLAGALKRVDWDDDGLRLDLLAVARIHHAPLGPLQRWAQCRLNSLHQGQPTVVLLGTPSLELLAGLCGITTRDLTRRLNAII